MKKRHTTYYVDGVSEVSFCGKNLYQLEINGAYEKPFETQLTNGEHDYNKCDVCQKNLEKLTTQLSGKFYGNEKKMGFPFCCKNHANLVKLKEFSFTDFHRVPEITAKKIIYTIQHITNTIKTENYYKDITDYIDYTVESFGKMPHNCGEPLYLSIYFNQIKHNINNNNNNNRKEFTSTKVDKLIEFIDSYYTENNKNTDLNILLSTYQKWLKVFPFEISFFSKLKAHFENQLPIFNGKPEYNKYSKKPSVKMHTKNSLVEALLNVTEIILTQINTAVLCENNLLPEPQKTKIELIINERKLKLKHGYTNKSIDESTKYRKILKEWYVDEKAFIDEITQPLELISKKNENAEQKFINKFVNGIYELQRQDIIAPCIKKIKLDGKKSEKDFQYWFKTYFSAIYKHVEAEPEKGDGRIDLKIVDETIGTKIIEFKGWWWKDGTQKVVSQIINYLTEFENTGYIFLINDLKEKDILNEYEGFIQHKDMGYIPNTWKPHGYNNTAFKFYFSEHKIGISEKKIYHFIYNVFHNQPAKI